MKQATLNGDILQLWGIERKTKKVMTDCQDNGDGSATCRVVEAIEDVDVLLDQVDLSEVIRQLKERMK